MGETAIPYVTDSWNPFIGCRKASPGCENCYAARLAATRLKNVGAYQGLAIAYGTVKDGIMANWTGEARVVLSRLDEPLRKKKPRSYFVNDMSDMFYEGFTDHDRDRVYAIMFGCYLLKRGHTFLTCTKRSKEQLRYLSRHPQALFLKWYERLMEEPCLNAKERELIKKEAAELGPDRLIPLRNLVTMVTVESQQYTGRIDELVNTPSMCRGVSVEPMLSALHLRDWVQPGMIDWVVIGAESGPRARYMPTIWATELVKQCRGAECAVFVKQLSIGNKVAKEYCDGWPEELRVRELPHKLDSFGG